MSTTGKLEYLINRHRQQPGLVAPTLLSEEVAAEARRFHAGLPGYAPTPLYPLPALSALLGLGGVFVKDESQRFGLNAFKSLGGSYAMANHISRVVLGRADVGSYDELRQPAARERLAGLTFVTATDGNHGRGVAWTAQQLGVGAEIYMPAGASPARVASIRAHGARCTVTSCNYDDTVRMAAQAARDHGWILLQDTAWPGYEEIPRWIMQGYLTLAAEAWEQIQVLGQGMPTHVILQAGVGSFAAAVMAYWLAKAGPVRPKIMIVEPDQADCLARSAAHQAGAAVAVPGSLSTIMAGLACGEPSSLAWPLLRDHADAFCSVDDRVAANGMRILAAPCGASDAVIVAGESGAVGAGLLYALMQDPAHASARQHLGLDGTARVLLINTEGDTAPEDYRSIVWLGA